MDVLAHEKPIQEYLKTIEHLKKQDNPLFYEEIALLEAKVGVLKERIYRELTPWQRVQICRHSKRPRALDFIHGMSSSFLECFGDRTYRDDPAIIGGLAQVGEMRCVLIGQERGKDTESRVFRNFGMPSPEGYRKAMRLMQLAEKFHLPVVTLLDTPGAYPGLEAEERGQGWAIAKNLLLMAGLKTPVIVVIIGEGCSGGALGMGMGNIVGMLEHAYYSVISPEGCASILWKDPAKNKEAADALKLNAEDLLSFGVIDQILREPLGGAHHDPEWMIGEVKQFLLEQWGVLSKIPIPLLLEQRYQKFRNIGAFSTESSV